MAIPMVFSDTIFDGIKRSESVDLWRKGDLSGTYAARSIFLDVTGNGFTLAIKGKVAKDAQLVELDYLQINTGRSEPILHGDLTVSWSTNRQFVIINPPPFVRLEAVGAGTLTVYGSFSTEAYSQAANGVTSAGLLEVAQLDPDMLQTTTKLQVDGEDVNEVNPVPVQVVDGEVKILGTVLIKNLPSFFVPRQIPPGQVAGAYAAGDAVGIQWEVECPKDWTLISATQWDLSDLNLQFNLTIANAPYSTQIADNAPFALSDADARLNIFEIQFTTFTDWVNNRMSLGNENIGKILNCPAGKMYLQLWTAAALTTVAGALPEIQLEGFPNV